MNEGQSSEWQRAGHAASEMGRMLSEVWRCGTLFPRQISPPSVQAACDDWVGRLIEDPSTLHECPAELRPLILSRLAAATIGAKWIESHVPFPSGATEVGALRWLLIDYWRKYFLPNWHKLGEDSFPM